MSKAWSKDIKLNSGTFGNSPACHILVDMMNKNMVSLKEKHRVLALITAIIYEFKAISTIKSSDKRHDVREAVMLRSRDYYLERVEKMPYPLIFTKLIIMNVIHHKCRKFLKEAA